MKIAIVYISVHHKNTEKIVRAIAEVSSADLFDLTKDNDIDLSDYDVVGIASGIYAGNMHKSILRFIDLHKLPKKVFIVFTSGVTFINYANKIKKLIEDKGIEIIGTFKCKGFNTFGPFFLIGGTGKGRPNEKDLNDAKKFMKKLYDKI